MLLNEEIEYYRNTTCQCVSMILSRAYKIQYNIDVIIVYNLEIIDPT